MKVITLFFLLNLTGFINAQDELPINDDTTRLRIGKRTFIVIGNDDNFDWDEDDFDCDSCNSRKFHLLPLVEFGTSGYLYSNKRFQQLPADQTTNLNYVKSRSIGLNIMIKTIESNNKRFYINSGIGVNWNNYSFKNNIEILTSNDSTIFQLGTSINYAKYNFKSSFVQLHLLAGFRLGNTNKRPLGLQLGATTGYKIGSKVKLKYKIDQTIYKDKIRHHYNLVPYQISLVARLCVGQLGLYARYSIYSLFEKNKATELHPVSAGLTIGGF